MGGEISDPYRTRISTQLVCIIEVHIVPHHYNYPALDIIPFFRSLLIS